MDPLSAHFTPAKTREPALTGLFAGVSPSRGLSFQPRFCPQDTHPWDTVTWEQRQAIIMDASGNVVFQQDAVEVPADWSQTATNVVASKYFRGHLGSSDRERSVRQLVSRVVDTIVQWGKEDGYFADDASAETYRNDLAWLCVHQHLAFNSPVWFNVGVEAQPQCSACFINSVTDTMESILELAKIEGMLFKWGSGTGTNLSPLRSCREKLRGGGTASGPVSFMRGFDAFAGVIKSGGKTRRAAKMVILSMDHPDILDFIRCKAAEEKKAWALIEAGYDGAFHVHGGAYDSVFFQNSNNSVRVTDAFMDACVNDGTWTTHAVTTGEVMDTYRARMLLDEIADAAWVCGDPGIQFDTTVNDWNTCASTVRINASNPCSEFMFVDDSACNLASLNLLRFLDAQGRFDVERLRDAVRIAITAQDIVVDRASYPTDRIRRNSRYYRPLGLGYANLGSLLMARGLAYDSDAGRAFAAAVTSLITGEAYAWSARVAAERGPFTGYRRNAESMLRVIGKHRSAAQRIQVDLLPQELKEPCRTVWDEAEQAGREHGYRNAQVTVLAPTGTIGFLMDCDTTGVEPEFALVKYKKLVGGGSMKIVNRTVSAALTRLGYDEKKKASIAGWLEKHETIEGAKELAPEHLPVFDCAFKPLHGKRSISPMGHVLMMAAVQPFISGAISKTVNLPESYTPQDIGRLYLDAWRLGLKAIAVYRDNSKRSQPLSTTGKKAVAPTAALPAEPDYRPHRHRLPSERKALTHKFNVAGHEGYVTVGMYDDGSVGELFIVMAKEGSVVSGLVDGFATSVSLALQYGVPLQVLCDKFMHTRFEPSGFTGNPEIPIAKSILDYIFRWLEHKFLTRQVTPADGDETPPTEPEASPDPAAGDGFAHQADEAADRVFVNQADAPPCHECGSIMVRSGACYKCTNCGATSGCS
ncbi:MAG: vitamin B12-dependent ribonucleotide reductase [Deltaproteobacteria bacterium]|nr:vitamin B12-dependent ribonucleotide reductase [Deltaproteobacteria bacterium]